MSIISCANKLGKLFSDSKFKVDTGLVSLSFDDDLTLNVLGLNINLTGDSNDGIVNKNIKNSDGSE